ncbi:hypothetical protein ACHAXR_011761, partial [Thalassiosira sp. AJA248-18]
NEVLRKIGGEAFGYCSSLESIRLPSTVTEVGDRAFWDFIELKEVVPNEGLQKIGRQAYRDCPLLDSIRLPSTVTEVGNQAFRVAGI